MKPKKVAPGLYRISRRQRTRMLGGHQFRVINLGRWWVVINIERKSRGGWWF